MPRENWLPSVARSGISGIGEVDLFTLLKESFRQNPDYVIVGEVRGKEAFVLFQGMASGHPSIATIHADSVESVIDRLETPPISLNPSLLNILDVLAVMTHAVVKKQETRRVREVVEILDVNNKGVASSNQLIKWNPSEDKFYFKISSHVFDKICTRYGIEKEKLLEEFELRTKLIFKLFKKGISEFNEIQKIVSEYYKDPEAVLEKYKII